MRINSTAQGMINRLGQTQRTGQQLSSQLASGNRLQSASTDAAGLAIANKMMSQLIGFGQADRNVQDGISMLQTADGALSNAGNITNRINELTVQAANGTLNKDQRGMIQNEINQLTDELNGIANRTQFNNMNLLDGTFSEENGGAWIQSGANAGQGHRISIEDMSADSLGLGNISVVGDDGEQISQQIGATQTAMSRINSQRANIGASINRFEHTSSAIGTSMENTARAHSRIADTDMAKAAMQKTQNNILQQANISMLRNLMQSEEMMQNSLLKAFGI